jgi:GNAT superfamily N-acetyltransferase
VTLTPIDEPAFERRMASYEAALAAEQALSPEDARRQAWRRLPQGLATEDAYPRTVSAAGREIGWVFFARSLPGHAGTGWIHRLEIDPEFRSRGYGTAVLAAVEADLSARGVPQVGGPVTGPRLYELADRLGFRLMAQQMSKKLPEPG